MGGVLQIQAVFPESGAIVINRFGDYEDQPYIVVVQTEKNGADRELFRFAQRDRHVEVALGAGHAMLKCSNSINDEWKQAAATREQADAS